MTDWALNEPTTEETSATIPSLDINNVLQWLQKSMPPETIAGEPGRPMLTPQLPLSPSGLFNWLQQLRGPLGLQIPLESPLKTQAEFPAEEGLAELMRTTAPGAEIAPKVTAPTPTIPTVPSEEERIPIEAQMPTTREPKEGEPALSEMISAPPTVAAPTPAIPIPGAGWKGLPPELLQGMTPEQFGQQLEGILAQRPKTVTELAGPLPEEGKRGSALVRALQNFGIKLAGGDPDKWRAEEQLRLDRIWTKNLELAMLNMNARQQTEFMKLNFAIKSDEEKRKGAQLFLANAVTNNPDIQRTEGFQRSAMAAWRLPAEAINEWIDSHRDPKTGELTNLYMSPTEQFVKEMAAKFTLITTMFPDIDKEKLPIFLLGGKWPEFERSFTDRIGKKLMSAKPEERERLLKLLAQFEEVTKGEGYKFPNKLEAFAVAGRNMVKAGLRTPAQANADLVKFYREYFIPKTVEAEAKIEEERIKAGAGAGKAGEEEKRYKLKALKGGDLGVFSFVPGGKAYLAGKTDEAIAQATTFRMVLNKYSAGEKLDNDEKRMLRTWQAAQVGYLGSPTGLNKGQLYQQIRKLTGSELGSHQLDAVIQMIEQGIPDSEILKQFRPTKR